jgi:hypothetical protein
LRESAINARRKSNLARVISKDTTENFECNTPNAPLLTEVGKNQMISIELHNAFAIMEMATFPDWQKANEQRRAEITRKLGKVEAQMIIEEIKKNAHERFKIQ